MRFDFYFYYMSIHSIYQAADGSCKFGNNLKITYPFFSCKYTRVYVRVPFFLTILLFRTQLNLRQPATYVQNAYEATRERNSFTKYTNEQCVCLFIHTRRVAGGFYIILIFYCTLYENFFVVCVNFIISFAHLHTHICSTHMPSRTYISHIFVCSANTLYTAAKNLLLFFFFVVVVLLQGICAKIKQLFESRFKLIDKLVDYMNSSVYVLRFSFLLFKYQKGEKKGKR